MLTHAIQAKTLPAHALGRALTGATVEKVGFQRSVTAMGVARLLSAMALVPALGNQADVIRVPTGAPDSLPISARGRTRGLGRDGAL